ncbi:MAG: FAD-binding oxidoreductase [Halocynthiibacter sp.]
MTLLDTLREILPDDTVFTHDIEKYSQDWLGKYPFTPLAVVKPRTSHDVSRILMLANTHHTPVVPMSGNTSLAGGTKADGAIVLSMERMNKIKAIRPEAKIAIVEAGVILADLHAKAAEHDLIFPLTFGARGSAMIGGNLSTNAGGSNVLRYGNTRGLCLGLEVVMPNGEIMNLMSELHKDNSGYDLKDLFIGAEGTLGVITGAVLKLAPKPKAYATAMVATKDLSTALNLLNTLQDLTGGAVEAFEYMPRDYMDALEHQHPELAIKFDTKYETNIMVEVGAIAPRDYSPRDDGSLPVQAMLEEILGDMLEAGDIFDAIVAQNEDQREKIWAARELAGELMFDHMPICINDIALPLEKVATFMDRMRQKLAEIDPQAYTVNVAHLGDGNVHYAASLSSSDPALNTQVMEAVENLVAELGGTFSAEHGIGLSKKPSMARHKDPVALSVMRQIKRALDPNNIMNPGKVIPDA